MDNDLDDRGGNRWNAYMEQIPFVGKYLEKKEQIAIVRMGGVIADSSMMRRAGINFKKFEGVIEKAFEVPRLKAVALVINSPGGAPAQCSLIATQIRSLSREKDVPVFAFVEDVAASGGYWLACAGDEIYAQDTSIVGSIGVISSGFGLEDFIKRYDIKRRVHTSGRDKSFLDPFKPEDAEDVARLKDIQSDMHGAFKDWVKSRRGAKLNGDETDLMEGAFWTGRAALGLGLIDGIGDAQTVLKDKFGDEIKFIDCSPEKKSLLSSLLPFGGDADARLDVGAVFDAAEHRAAWNRFGL